MLVESSTYLKILPEIILVALAVWTYVGGTFKASRAFWGLFSVGVYVVAMWVLLQQTALRPVPGQTVSWQAFLESGARAYSGPLLIDSLGLLVRWLGISSGFVLTLSSFRSANRRLASEHFATIMMISAGIMLSGQANDLVLLFVSLELITIPTYILLFIGGTGKGASEATVKYFFLSLLSSALLLYGFSFLYGLTGTTLLFGTVESPGVREILASSPEPRSAALLPLASVAVILILAGMGFKLAAAPFHFYAPDVYQGTNHINAGLLAVAPKIAGTAALIRLIVVTMPVNSAFAWQVVLVLSALSMTLGNVCALWQKDLRRMMAYSSIGHAGYLLIGLGAAIVGQGEPEFYGGIAAMLFYLTVYTFATLGTFVALNLLSHDDRDVHRLEDLSGLGTSRPHVAAALAIFMFSLAGIPPLAGFWGKLTLFSESLNVATLPQRGDTNVWAFFVALAVIAALNAAIAAAYYLRVVATMFFEHAASQTAPQTVSSTRAVLPGLALTGCAALVVMVGIFPAPIIRFVGSAERSLMKLDETSDITESNRRWLAADQAPRP